MSAQILVFVKHFLTLKPTVSKLYILCKGQIINILGFAGHYFRLSLAHTLLCLFLQPFNSLKTIFKPVVSNCGSQHRDPHTAGPAPAIHTPSTTPSALPPIQQLTVCEPAQSLLYCKILTCGRGFVQEPFKMIPFE